METPIQKQNKNEVPGKQSIDVLIDGIYEKQSPLCITIVPPTNREYWDQNQASWKIPHYQELLAYNQEIIAQVAPIVPALAFDLNAYLSLGSEGMQALAESIQYAKTQGVSIMLNTNISPGDDETAQQLAKTFVSYPTNLQQDSNQSQKSWTADFITITPYPSLKGVSAIAKVATEYKKGIFTTVLTEDTSILNLQRSRVIPTALEQEAYFEMLGKETESIFLYERIALGNQRVEPKAYGTHGYTNIGAQIALTTQEEMRTLRALMYDSYFLISDKTLPQTLKDQTKKAILAEAFKDDGTGALILMSSEILVTPTATSQKEVPLPLTPANVNAINERLRQYHDSLTKGLEEHNKYPLQQEYRPLPHLW
ncbi:MAG: hypothetical protein QW594_01610 [Candidatus Woesearchaeota archaeon]